MGDLVGSGLDLNTIVTQLVALERQPITKLQTQASSLNSKISLYGTVNSNSGASIEVNYDTLYQGNLNNAGAFSFANGAKLTVGSGGTRISTSSSSGASAVVK